MLDQNNVMLSLCSTGYGCVMSTTSDGIPHSSDRHANEDSEMDSSSVTDLSFGQCLSCFIWGRRAFGEWLSFTVLFCHDLSDSRGKSNTGRESSPSGYVKAFQSGKANLTKRIQSSVPTVDALFGLLHHACGIAYGPYFHGFRHLHLDDVH